MCELIRYQVDLTAGPDQVYPSGLPDSEWLALDSRKDFSATHFPTSDRSISDSRESVLFESYDDGFLVFSGQCVT
jgi:hypothetical protein